ncbi:PEP-utilizing enzyme [Rugamonas rubra]|uniref:PEP-utilising enzyme, mobile domain n=1 Tax=Rugamonas rubra TaxID=758825 RepID=A0A1I4N089_9BURK|nr:PEP-utilizing enzyme [Rugamonas rubra]SFM08737.1 PEP-utilising enzyme, mobile domain [Rugamonas rubra]
MSGAAPAPCAYAGKAATLALLRGRLRSARVAPLVCFSVAAWRADRAGCLARVPAGLGRGPWIVRSSCRREDAGAASQAGAFLSLADVDAAGLARAVERVVASYGAPDGADEVLVQPMLRRVLRSGVAFSHDPNTCAPYRVVNWTEGADTSLVTAGAGGRTWQQAARAPLAPPRPLAPVLALLEELLALFAGAPVDCEFAVTAADQDRDQEGGRGRGETLWLLQARPLLLARPPEAEAAQAERLQRIHDKVSRGMRPHPFLMGGNTAYGVMPDWNPAEIIGVRPLPLALSLYRDLVTDAIWAYQRHNYGYRNLRSFPLMPHFFGLPYIDVRLSFNSFIPADLDDALAGRLVDHYVGRLLAEPALHDKVEFDIVFSCYTLDLPQRLRRLDAAGFGAAEQGAIADSLRRLTNRIVQPGPGCWRQDAAKIDTLELRRRTLLAAPADPLERIYWLLEDAKRYGTLPFAGLARAGFIAVQILQSLVAAGVLSPADYDAFNASAGTVAGQMARDRAALPRAAFLARYGHLRPGTYNILSPRYDEAPELYFDWRQPPRPPAPDAPFTPSGAQLRHVGALLETHGLRTGPAALFDFLRQAIALRESAKFAFTRNLSDALALIGDYGAHLGHSREDMAYCDIGVFHELHVAAAEPARLLRHSIDAGRARHAETLATSLPPLITRPDQVWAFEWPASSPNFITQRRVVAPVAHSGQRGRLAGAIVCIPHADPGFDWLFAYPIAGLVTAWGGANSHMAIRAGELGLPAVIGAGEALYRRWSGAARLRIDCAGRVVEVLA